VEILAGLAIESDQVDDKAGTFADPQTGMIKKEDQQIIPTPEWRIKIDRVEDFTDFVF
jgi:hypothetical protein